MLYVVATPIGNLGDISMRAKEVLTSVKFIACEDTRHSKILLDSIGATGKAISFHAHSGQLKFDQIIELLINGEDVALISDAGTPAISDPGGKLVEQARLKGILVSPIPGASSVIAALSVAGFEADQFVYYGYLPKKKGKQTMLKEIAQQKMTSVIFESPHRIERTLLDFRENLEADRRICICRELTKKFEEIICDSISNIEFDKIKPLGEFVIVIEGTK
jgi:16S rRNA (cytidine1402-2'-O)-methyltransferase